MTFINDHKKEDGTTDWNAYNAAQVACGDICQTCGKYILNIRIFGPARDPAPQDCTDCRSMNTDDGEVTHDKYLRCPKCKNKWDPFECEDYHVAGDGEHDVYCVECDHTFEVVTHVSHSFESPAIIESIAATEQEAKDLDPT